ncbi:DUF3149 domain-containing protein [Flocculibacter collagenilyticus]|nr:DUF3149 domain-containing protein [Flocculibacter collagenilyticus]
MDTMFEVFFRDFFSDPVLLVSFAGLALVIGLCVFYACYFAYQIHQAPKS